MLKDCSQFALGSRQRQVCEGQSNWTISRVNKFREMHGIEPLPDNEVQPAIMSAGTIPSGASVVIRNPPDTFKPSGSCCGGNRNKTNAAAHRMVEGTGVGGRLIEIFKSHGFEACEECYALARKMNEWGPDGCRGKIDFIVNDILPRALEWEKQKLGWIASMLPESVTAAGIKKIIEHAIETAKPLEWIAIPPSVKKN